ncbi:GNAT family N-acetyltransferase [Anoxybacillus sp. LAT_35]|uniref:GNAT family N-acetyltransferase n=1 Tax=Anoxybacillus TaxID=150247 RepID=UPI001EDC0B23|nr:MULTISPECIES: GNAT family N-acetyltransferase [Anoxybacillus]MCG5026632.1 GNAT family N-acetyltransferase [Anoxybacillus flavithermus]MCG6196909.1 GNAT family N-acetyltransferase [Anoxybacillus sp. LAT_38]MCG3083245.1 GNAT family N-acetyltransferase [Anoxybacillus sp. LAT27]MCG6171261.1 GNAT family N-acetyltransferase [Anoxybacillus sp. LAT_11]MCG6176355.1 GNAT family N-acetyltransferase [Anoxybacillus sp. LAT_31]
MLQIKRLSECTLEEAVRAWNAGFEGYYFPIQLTLESFLQRLVGEGLSPSLSIIVFHHEEPVGIVLNGIREFQGTLIAWNGGTGVAPAFRKTGIGTELMEATLDIYQQASVELATLEAISENERAIGLYKKFGYEIVDELEYLQFQKAIPRLLEDEPFQAEITIPEQISHLSFYKGRHPWQTQWQSAKNDEALLAKDERGYNIGYAYYRRVFDATGKHEKTILFQCEAHPARDDAEPILRFLLTNVFGTCPDEVVKVVANIPITYSSPTYSLLKEIGFQTTVKQVWMQKRMR